MHRCELNNNNGGPLNANWIVQFEGHSRADLWSDLCRLFGRFAQGIGREYRITKFTMGERTSLQSLNNRWVCEYLLFRLSFSHTPCRNKSPVWSTGLFSDCLEKNEHAFKWANNAKIYDNWSRVECPHSRENKLLKHCIWSWT